MKKILLPFSCVSLLVLTSCSVKNVIYTVESKSTPVELHSEDQLTRFINNPDILTDTMLNYLNGLDYRIDYSKCQPVELNFTAKAEGGKLDLSKLKVTISDCDETLASGYSFTVDSDSKASFYNAKINTKYYWQLNYNDQFKSEIATFTTNTTPIRTIDVDGVKNVRDISFINKIKQGLIYRGGAFESYDSRKDLLTINVTEKGKDTLVRQLGIKTEIDLRRDDDKKENCDLSESSVKGLNRITMPMQYAGNNILTFKDSKYDNPAKFKAIFELMADQNNYPFYFHCSQGKDRTGAIAYVIEALLGLDEDSLYRDYLFSNFADVSYGMKRDGIDGYFGQTLHDYLRNTEPELTLAERTYRYLNEVVEISETTLNSVINILKDERD